MWPDETPNLKLPFILAAQAQKHVTHNEAIRALDALVQLSVLDRDLSAPPASPPDGGRYIVADAPTGAWSGQALQIAAWQDGAWVIYTPLEGFVAWVADEDVLVAWNGTAWVSAGGGGAVSLNPAAGGLVGVNATADATNRLAVSSPASLFNHAGAGHQQKINKATATDTASVLFQTAFSGRAEFGLTGDDNWHVKVSPDGAAWFEVLVADRATGRVSFPSGGVREKLSANGTYYVSPSGNDSNSGLTAGSPLATVNAAIAKCYAIDDGGFALTIQLADGTYTFSSPITVNRPIVGGGRLTINGNATTPGNVVLQGTYPVCSFSGGTKLKLSNVRLQSSSTGSLVYASEGADVHLSGIEWNTCQRYHIEATGKAIITLVGADTIVASDTPLAHIYLSARAGLVATNQTTTLTGTPTFTNFIMVAASDYAVWNHTFVGSASGTRYSVTLNGTINTYGKGATHFPGSVAGTTATGGQYT